MVERNMRKTMIGVVTSDKMDKTIVVSVVDNVKHPLYGKIVKKTYKLRVMETRPLSKNKRWRLVEIVERAK